MAQLVQQGGNFLVCTNGVRVGTHLKEKQASSMPVETPANLQQDGECTVCPYYFGRQPTSSFHTNISLCCQLTGHLKCCSQVS